MPGTRDNHPDDGCAAIVYGNYGSTVFDPLNGSYLELNICDGCLVGAALKGRVLYHAGRVRPHLRNPTPWQPPASAIEARNDVTGTDAAEGESATPQGDAQ
jgi:hypothetical protein